MRNLAFVILNIFTHLISSPVYNEPPIAMTHLHKYHLVPLPLGMPFLTV